MNDINVKITKKKNKNIPQESETIIESIDWEPKIKRLDEEIKLDYGMEYKYPQLGCIN